MIIGKWYKVTQIVAVGSQHDKAKTHGKCIWIHPQNRFGVLEFDGGIRECFTDLEIGNK